MTRVSCPFPQPERDRIWAELPPQAKGPFMTTLTRPDGLLGASLATAPHGSVMVQAASSAGIMAVRQTG